MSTHLLLTKYDISPDNHKRWPGIMARFVESFSAPVRIGGVYEGIGAGEDGRRTIGKIVSVEQRGEDLWGDVTWIGEPPPITRYIKMNWSSGPGPERVSLSSGFLDHWPHRTSWEEDGFYMDDEFDDPDSDDYDGWGGPLGTGIGRHA